MTERVQPLAAGTPEVLPAVPARRARWACRMLAAYGRAMMRRHFHSVQVKNVHHLQACSPQQPILAFANHSNWWDGLTDFLLMTELLPERHLFMMVEELRRFPALALVGGFSIEKSSPQAALHALQYAVALLNASPRHIVWLYPQGEVRPLQTRPLDFHSGMGYVAQHLPQVTLLPVAQYYTFLDEEKPEIFINIGPPLVVEPGWSRRDISQRMEAAVTGLLEEIQADVAQKRFTAYDLFLQGCFNPYKALESSVMQSCRLWAMLLKPWRVLTHRARGEFLGTR